MSRCSACGNIAPNNSHQNNNVSHIRGMIETNSTFDEHITPSGISNILDILCTNWKEWHTRFYQKRYDEKTNAVKVHIKIAADCTLSFK